jgi:hypothetical protein
MSTYSLSETFTRTEARYLASKVVADLYQCSRLYRSPAASWIPNYETELVERLVKGYLSRYEFGFERDDKRVVSWQYEVKDGDLVSGSDDRSGGIYARANLDDASYYNTTTSSTKWWLLTDSERAAFETTLPISRVDASLPADGSGYWTADKTYTRGGVGVARRTFRPL